jgi:adenylate cyclase
MSFFAELKRRNVFRVAAAYAVIAWLLVEVSDTIFPRLGLPDWTVTFVIVLLLLGFPLSLFFAWAYELTPEGLRRERDVDPSESITPQTGRKLDRLTIAVLALALAFFAVDKFVLDPHREAASEARMAAELEEARQAGRVEALAVGRAADDRSIVVLPFVDMSADKDQEYLSDGIAEELLNLLARIPELRVISRSSAFAFKGEKIEMTEIAKRLNVAHVLEGSVRKSGDRVRITAQLIDARSDAHLWSDTYDRTLDDIFAIQDEIAVTVLGQLRVTLLGEAPKVEATRPDAYALFLAANHMRRLNSAESNERAVALYQQVLDIDPDYAPARLGMVASYINQAQAGWRPFDEGYALARELTDKVLAAEPDNAEAHNLLAWIVRIYDGDLAVAARHAERALALDPGNTRIIGSTSQLMLVLGRPAEATAFLEHAASLDPLNPVTKGNLALDYLTGGRLEDAIGMGREALSLSPDMLLSRFVVGMALLLQGDADSALAEIERESNAEFRGIGLMAAYSTLGRSDEAGHELSQLIAARPQYEPLYRASYFAWQQEPDEAFDWLGRVVESRVSMSNVHRNWALRSLSSDPRWLPFLESMGQSPEQLAAIQLEVTLPR